MNKNSCNHQHQTHGPQNQHHPQTTRSNPNQTTTQHITHKKKRKKQVSNSNRFIIHTTKTQYLTSQYGSKHIHLNPQLARVKILQLWISQNPGKKHQR